MAERAKDDTLESVKEAMRIVGSYDDSSQSDPARREFKVVRRARPGQWHGEAGTSSTRDHLGAAATGVSPGTGGVWPQPERWLAGRLFLVSPVAHNSSFPYD